MKNKAIVAMAQKHGISVPQLYVKYVLQLDAIALPKTSNLEHMKADLNLDFNISNEDIESLKTLDCKDYGEFSYFPVFSGK